MQKSLVVSLCVLATLVLIEARPWYSKGGYDSYSNGYSSASGGYGGSGGFGGSSGYGGSGGYGENGGYMSGQYGGGGHSAGGQYPNSNSNGVGFYPRAPGGCVNCVIRGFGDGEDNTNTFNLPAEAYV